MIVTRYLYEKEHVKYSLIETIRLGVREEAKFWAMELYFSGFQTETIELVGAQIGLLDAKYSQIIGFLHVQMTELRACQSQYWILGTIIENICVRQTKIDMPKHIVIGMRESDMKQYKTKLVIKGKSWKIPQRVCVFPLRQNPDLEPVSMDIYDNWLYWASFSPIWKARIDKHRGTVRHETREVVFDDDDFDNFHNWHNYEPDEQPMNIKQNWCGAGNLRFPCDPSLSIEPHK